jgi:hypothetical protein
VHIYKLQLLCLKQVFFLFFELAPGIEVKARLIMSVHRTSEFHASEPRLRRKLCPKAMAS